MWELAAGFIAERWYHRLPKWLLRKLFKESKLREGVTLQAGTTAYFHYRHGELDIGLLIMSQFPADLIHIRCEVRLDEQYITKIYCDTRFSIPYAKSTLIRLPTKSLTEKEINRIPPNSSARVSGIMRFQTKFCIFEVAFSTPATTTLFGLS